MDSVIVYKSSMNKKLILSNFHIASYFVPFYIAEWFQTSIKCDLLHVSNQHSRSDLFVN